MAATGLPDPAHQQLALRSPRRLLYKAARDRRHAEPQAGRQPMRGPGSMTEETEKTRRYGSLEDHRRSWLRGRSPLEVSGCLSGWHHGCDYGCPAWEGAGVA